jgi:D-glycero-alpha-D-manno-heptose-7-phosphate kinase
MQRVLARAPGRIDLAGGGTDPEPYCSDYGGAVLNLAITCHTQVTVAELSEPIVRLRSLDFQEEIEVPLGEMLPLEGRLGLLAAAANRLPPSRGAEISAATELPPGSGLSSSASLGVALLAALSRFNGRQLAPRAIADLHSEVERFDLRIWGGKQDPYACAFGGLRFWRFEGATAREEPLDLPEWVPAVLERDLKLVHSGTAHLSGSIHNDILEDYRRGDSRVKRAQHRLKDVAVCLRDALQRGDLREAGRCLDENWLAHQELHESCATPRLFEVIERGKEAGAWGAKVCGAGGGGGVVFLAPPERHQALASAMEAVGARMLPFKIDRDGVRTWEV